MTAVAMQGGQVVLHDGKVGLGPLCCCDCCLTPLVLPPGKEVQVTVTITIPDDPSTTCDPGVYTAQFNMLPLLGYSYGNQTIQINGSNVCVGAGLSCVNNKYEANVVLDLEGACGAAAGFACLFCFDPAVPTSGVVSIFTAVYSSGGQSGTCLPFLEFDDTVCGVQFHVVYEVI